MIGGEPFDSDLARDVLSQIDAEAALANPGDQNIQGSLLRLADQDKEESTAILEVVLMRTVQMTGFDPHDPHGKFPEQSLGPVIGAWIDGFTAGVRYAAKQAQP